MVEDTGGGASTSPYKLLTYNNTNGYVAATAANTGGSTSILTSGSNQLVVQAANATMSGAAQAYPLSLQSGFTITATRQP